MQKMLRQIKNKNIISIIFIVFLIIPAVGSILTQTNNIFSKDQLDNYSPYIRLKTSGDNINITTPENITYTAPMSGYYPATYGFENDEIGNNPHGFITSEDVGCTLSTIPSLDGHRNVVELSDSNSTGRVALECVNYYTPAGTIEFWMRTDEVIQRSANFIYANEVQNRRFTLKIENSKFQWSGGPYDVWNDVGLAAMANRWYHFRIVFDFVADFWELWIDGIKYSGTGYYMEEIGVIIDHFFFSTLDSPSGLHVYLDAIGLSSDPNYNIGDNVNEGLLLSYENSTVLDWTGYSLDGAANITNQGNTTIPLPEDGHHTIQVSGTSPGGIDYQSDVRHFTVKNGSISIITPENTTYTKPMSGYYPATHGFENDQEGNDPRGFEVLEEGSNTVNVVSGDALHKNIVELHDISNSDYCQLRKTYITPRTYGTVEFWFKTLDVTQRTDFVLYSGGDPLNFVWIYLDNITHIWWYVDHVGAGYCYQIPNIAAPQNNAWQHWKIQFRCDGAATWQGLGTNRWKAIVDGVDSGELLSRSIKTQTISFDIYTQRANTADINSYVDAIGFSWDPNYNIGDNINEGLLLSHENSTILDWTGYSLDGAANITIQGNTTIPLPEDGHHTIQVSGTSPGGIDYQSDVRYFTMKNGSISIITPENTTYTEPMSGYYPATYGFDNGEIWNILNGFNITEDVGCTLTIIPSLDGHKNVVELSDSNSTGRVALECVNYYTPAGTIEFWMRTDDVIQRSANFIYANEAQQRRFMLKIETSKFQWSGGPYGVWHDVGLPATANRWYHFRIAFDFAADFWELWIDNIKYSGTGYYMEEIGDGIDHFYFCTVGPESGLHVYLDAIGLSSDPNYNIGDNVNEGLLLSYENSTVLDWMGYSLDGTANITIQGNTTIPMPTGNGLHSIQVFGTTPEGYIIESKKRDFSLDWDYVCLRPTLNILDMINEFGLHFEIDLKSIGLLHVDRQSFTFPGLPNIGYNQSTSYFYSINLYNPYFIKDTSILSSITIRFYYDPLEINDPEKLQLYHYISSLGQWYAEDIIINTAQHYVEITTTELSYFCLSETDIPIIPIPWLIIIIIIILSTIGLSIPSSYVIISRRKKKNESNYKYMKKQDSQTNESLKWNDKSSLPIKEIKPKIFPNMITPIKPLESKSTPSPKKLKKSIKTEEEPKIVDIALSQKVIEEIKKTEKEMKILDREDYCQVHKGPVTGIAYICPKCKAKYCMKCAKTLSQRGENCWVCNTIIKLDSNENEIISRKNKSSTLKPLDNNNLKKIFNSKKVVEEIEKTGDMNISLLDKNFMDKVNQFEWNENEKQQFIREMIALPPMKRERILNRMIKFSNYKGD